ncbi:MAG: endo alpha-1,4 polygalactosaminidase [Nitrospirae bacterium]|nr:endo alpha-1,4 polygalactosaminidase [Nitrospirota bacterium]
MFLLALAVGCQPSDTNVEQPPTPAPASGAGNGSGNGSGGGSEPGPTPAPAAWYVPPATATWQWQLSGTVNTTYPVNVYDIDLFDSPTGLIANVQAGGRRVVCYFSAGSYENWRPDAGAFPPADLGNALGGWPGERWLDIRSADVRRLMAARLNLALQKGCDAVEPDNVDGYTQDTGFPLSGADQLAYNRFLAAEAHARGLGIALKNDLDQVAALVDAFDFAVNEQCHQYNECDLLRPFTDAGKAVFNAEYNSVYVNDAARRAQLCAGSIAAGLRTLILPVNLNDAFRHSCD